MANAFCEMFGVEQPVVLAPMAGVVPPELVAAVSNAGGLGLAPLWHVPVDELRDGIRRVRELTDAPFGVNLNVEFCDRSYVDACLEEGVEIVSLFWQQPGELLKIAKSGGAKVIYTAGDAADAKRAVDAGADAICAQGWEAGGHVRGTVSTMALVPAVVDAVGDAPVIAAGGIADGRGMAAAMALGASAVWVGTRLLAAEEAAAHPDYIDRLINASENDTGWFADLFDIGWPNAPHRVLRNSTVELWESAGCPPLGQRPGEGDVLASSPLLGDFVRYTSVSPSRTLSGDTEALSMWSGQGVAQVRRVQPAAEIVREILDEARAILPF